MNQTARLVMVLVVAVALAACSGGSVTGQGTSNSPFVGTYVGSTTVTVVTANRSETIESSVSVFVNRDGLVQFGDPGSTIFASAPLRGDQVKFEGPASALVDLGCSGAISLAGHFSPEASDGATFEGAWSSNDVFCFGVAGTISGPISASRVKTDARASRVFETNNPAILRAFQHAID